jgi:hypothetical protein
MLEVFGLIEDNSGGGTSMRYLQDPSAASSQGRYIGNGSRANFTGVPAHLLSYLVGQLFNTYYMMSQQVIINQTSYLLKSTASAQVTTSMTVCTLFLPRLVAFLFAGVVLFSAAVLGIVISWMTITPDILGYVSSLVRDSKYIDLLLVGGALDGIALSTLLKDKSIRFGVVDQGAHADEHLAVAWEDEVAKATKSCAYN